MEVEDIKLLQVVPPWRETWVVPVTVPHNFGTNCMSVHVYKKVKKYNEKEGGGFFKSFYHCGLGILPSHSYLLPVSHKRQRKIMIWETKQPWIVYATGVHCASNDKCYIYYLILVLFGVASYVGSRSARRLAGPLVAIWFPTTRVITPQGLKCRTGTRKRFNLPNVNIATSNNKESKLLLYSCLFLVKRPRKTCRSTLSW